MRFEHYLEMAAASFGQKVAIVAGSKRVRYSELDAASAGLAGKLVELGVRRGDRVLVLMENCWEAAASIFAIWRAGAVFSVINPSTKAAKLAYILDDAEPVAVLTQARLVPVLREALKIRARVEPITIISTEVTGTEFAGDILSFEQACAGPAVNGRHDGTSQDLAMLVYTSGSTGRPKGVMMTHDNVDAASGSIVSYLAGICDDVVFNVLPLAFDYGLYQLLMSVRQGATLVLEKSFAFPAAMFEIMRNEGVTALPLVPTMAAVILQMRDLAPGSLPSLRYITNTAAALPVEHIAKLRALFPKAALYSMYGLTECKRCTYLPPAELDRRPGSVGIPIPGTEGFVVDGDGRIVEPGEVGELVIQGPHVMQGYWRDAAATRRALRPGPNPRLPALHTGDLFRQDKDGFLYFVGRRDDIIKTRGEKVAPKEVEAVLHSHPGVAEAVVTGIADPILGQAISALVIPRNPSITERELIRFCQQNLEDYMVPKYITFTSSLPKTDTGKVSRKLATELLEAAQ